jgi:Domain of unknown function (DUF6265)
MTSYPTTGLVGASVADLQWLEGDWLGRYGEDVVEEMWSNLRGEMLMGMFRWLRDDEVRFFEFITLGIEEGLVVLRIKHMNVGLASWEEQAKSTEFVLVHLQEQEAVFLQRNKPNPPWMIYRREPDRLITYFQRDEETPPEDDQFVYSRI